MEEKDWNDLGKDLNHIVEDAVRRRDFGNLNQSINDTIQRAFSDMGDDGSAPHEKVGKKADSNKNLFASKAKRRTGPIIMLIIGIVIAFIFFFVLLALLTVAALGARTPTIVLLVVTVILGALAAILIVRGISGMRLSKRFEQYLRSLEGAEYADIKKLSVFCHRSEANVLKDLKKMMKKSWFKEGHLDRDEKCFMTTDAMYKQYLDIMKKTEMQRREDINRQRERAGRSGEVTPEVQAVLDQGNEYIESIRKSSDAIPGEKISGKIHRMETLVQRIFEQTELHPEKTKDLRKLMDYYLPMTVKLLKAYEELDGQPIKGENIESSKKEIEDVLDTLNKAFERLLDRLFQDTAWDVSSDISVLETMLAQEGLTGDDFSK